MYKPFHLIGLELSISVLSAALRGEPTGSSREWRGDVAAISKRPLKTGEILDGEGGYTVYGHLVPAHRSKQQKLLPIGLAHGVRVLRDIPAGVALSEDDVALDMDRLSVKIRHEMTATFSPNRG